MLTYSHMTIPAWSGSREEKQAIVDRLRVSGRNAIAERLARGSNHDVAEFEASHGRFDGVLDRLAKLQVQTLRSIERELSRPDTMANIPYLNGGGPYGSGADEWLSHMVGSGRAVRTDVSIRDGLAYRDLTRVFGPIFDRPYRAVRDFFALTGQQALCEMHSQAHTQRAVTALLRTLMCIYASQLTQTTKTFMKPNMGYAGMDAWADSQDACTFSSRSFATLVLTELPSVDELVGLLDSGALARTGLSPTTTIDRSELREWFSLSAM